MIGSDLEGADPESRVATWAAGASSDDAAAVRCLRPHRTLHWTITQHMYPQLPERSEGAAPASSESATRIRARSASACGRRARRDARGHVTSIYLPVQGPGR